ncbi:MAG: acyl carrier protein [Chloroflexota bacterium]|nr:acyl carrier protein [Chloroflexota bacterium]
MAADGQVLADLLELISELAQDWEYGEEITEATLFLRDLGLESLDLVVLGAAIQARHGRLPFTEFLAEVGERPPDERDVSVGELVAFVCRYRPVGPKVP